MADPRHLTDTELLSWIDGERSESAVHAHLSNCMPCRARRAQLVAISEELKNIYRMAAVPDASSQREQLQWQMRKTPQPTPWWWPRISGTRWRYLAASFVLSIAGISMLAWHETQDHRSAPLAEITPNREFTPGATHPVELAEICAVQQDLDLDPTVPPEEQRAVMSRYGLDHARPGDFQIDYLINPQLGGTSDESNLWPEPYGVTAWNARAKDALEERMHQMVCQRQLDLNEAQAEISTNWIAAYKKYFHTDRPAI